MLESENVGIFLWSARWDWEKPRSNGERQGLGMYPHFSVNDAATVVERARKAGYRIIQEPRKYDWGTEAFIADPDGYTWRLCRLQSKLPRLPITDYWRAADMSFANGSNSTSTLETAIYGD